MTLEGKPGIGLTHPAAVVNDLYAGPSGIDDIYLDEGRPGINGVLNEFLDNGCRSLYDFSGSNLIGNGVW